MIIILLLSVIDISSFVYAGQSDKIVIENINTFLENGNLCVSANIKNLFTQKTISTIQSGLPIAVKIELELMKSSDEKVQSKTLIRTISYNIWDEFYIIKSENQTFTTTELDSAIEICCQIVCSEFIPVASLYSNLSYTIQLMAQVMPISEQQGKKITDWLENPNRVGENMTSGQRSTALQFDAGKLLSFFVGKKNKSQNKSDWFLSNSFKIIDLLKK